MFESHIVLEAAVAAAAMLLSWNLTTRSSASMPKVVSIGPTWVLMVDRALRIRSAERSPERSCVRVRSSRRAEPEFDSLKFTTGTVGAEH